MIRIKDDELEQMILSYPNHNVTNEKIQHLLLDLQEAREQIDNLDTIRQEYLFDLQDTRGKLRDLKQQLDIIGSNIDISMFY